MKKFFAAIMAVALVACMMTAPAGAITTGKWEITDVTQDLIDKTLGSVPEYQPEAPEEPEPPVGPEEPAEATAGWVVDMRQIIRRWLVRRGVM